MKGGRGYQYMYYSSNIVDENSNLLDGEDFCDLMRSVFSHKANGRPKDSIVRDQYKGGCFARLELL